MNKIILIFTVIVMTTSCHNEELEKLKIENAVLKTELDSLKTVFKKEEERKKLFGEYVNTGKGFYKSFDFKGESSVVITDGIFGMPFATSYVKDGQLLRMRTDKSDLMLTIKDSKTLIGEGFSDGTYIKAE